MNIEQLLKTCVERGASDIHLAVGRRPCLRVHGEVRDLDAPVLTAAAIGFAISGGTTSKALTLSNTLTLAGTDGSTLVRNARCPTGAAFLDRVYAGRC